MLHITKRLNMSTVVGCKRLQSLEVVDIAKFDDKLVFDSLSMLGDSISLTTSNDISFISSTGSGTFMVGTNMTIDAVDGTIWIQAGVDSSSNGSIILRHGGGTPVVQFLYDEGTDQDRLGFFGATPIVKPTGVTADAASIRTALISLGLIS